MFSLIRSGFADDVVAGAPRPSPLLGSMIDGQQPHGRGLAGAVGPHQAEDFPLRHGERQIIHGGQIAEPLRQMVGLDGVHGGRVLGT